MPRGWCVTQGESAKRLIQRLYDGQEMVKIVVHTGVILLSFIYIYFVCFGDSLCSPGKISEAFLARSFLGIFYECCICYTFGNCI